MCSHELRADPHSFALEGQPQLVHMDAVVQVVFEDHYLLVEQTLTFDRPGTVRLDFRGQSLHVSATDAETEFAYSISEEDPTLGSYVTFDVPDTLRVDIRSTTSQSALGMQWLTPEQMGGEHPLLYSQSETINGRSIFVAPDAPSARFTHAITVRAPEELRGLVAAGTLESTALIRYERIESWEMNTPVPLYLVGINVGDFEYHEFDYRCGVWASPAQLDKAASALSQTPAVMQALEKLFGPYLWETYSTVVLPALGYPFGAMEHPCLTSMNAMLIEDSYAATRVTIHEMMHSWFGNLITNHGWGDFWLNEGVTTFGEWFGIREVFGEQSMLMQIASSISELEKAIDALTKQGRPEWTCLKVNLEGVNPDDAFSRVPYYKGALFLWRIMQEVGEGPMLAFLRTYIATYQYRSVDTEEFLRFAAQELGEDVLTTVDACAWVYEPGMPANAPIISSPVAEEIIGFAERGEVLCKGGFGNDFQKWDLYFSKLSRKEDEGFYITLGEKFAKALENGMLEFEYLHACLEAPRMPVERMLDRTECFLRSCGRQVYIGPLYRALCHRGYVEDAKRIFHGARGGYHPIGRDQVEKILNQA